MGETIFCTIDPLPQMHKHHDLVDAIRSAQALAISSNRVIEVRANGETILTVWPQSKVMLFP